MEELASWVDRNFYGFFFVLHPLHYFSMGIYYPWSMAKYPCLHRDIHQGYLEGGCCLLLVNCSQVQVYVVELPQK